MKLHASVRSMKKINTIKIEEKQGSAYDTNVCEFQNLLTSDKAPANGVNWKMLDSLVMKLHYNLDPKSGA